MNWRADAMPIGRDSLSRRVMSAADPFDTCQIACGEYPGKPRLPQQRTHPLRLVVAMLEQQPAIRIEMRFRLCADAAGIVQSIRSGSQCGMRFEAHVGLRQMG